MSFVESTNCSSSSVHVPHRNFPPRHLVELAKMRRTMLSRMMSKHANLEAETNSVRVAIAGALSVPVVVVDVVADDVVVVDVVADDVLDNVVALAVQCLD